MAASQTTAVTDKAASGLLVYDGDCGFCTTAARVLRDRLGNSIDIAPWQALDLDEYSLTEAQVMAAAYWVQDGRTYRGADAFTKALVAAGGIWHIAGLVLGAPPFIWIARAVYPIVARYRHSLPGATDACRIDDQP